MINYLYTLDSHIKYDCPACGSHKRFTRYIDTTTGMPLANDVGRCDRINSCGYHKRPGEHFNEHGQPKVTGYIKPVQQQAKPTSYVPIDILEKSLTGYDCNNFVLFLNGLLGSEAADKLIERYHIGTSRLLPGANIFWEIDASNRIRTGKIMLYTADTGKRSRDGSHHPNWVHKTEKLIDFNANPCLFGEHLLKGNSSTVALVESEKTAIIASYFMPEYLWLATGGFTFFSDKMCQVLKGRTVILYPDLKCLDKWQEKAKQLSHIANFVVSDLLEKNATEEEIAQGLDIADYLIKFKQEQNAATQFSSLVAEFKSFCDLVVHRQKTAAENLAYTLDMERRLKEHGILLVDFVKATM